MQSPTIKRIADAILVGVHTDMPDAAFFTREDLLQLDALNHISTITRYMYVCKAVRFCVDRKWIMQIENNRLILTGGKLRYQQMIGNLVDYTATIVRYMPQGDFRVGDVVDAWDANTDQYLTVNAKRVFVRNALNVMTRKGVLEEVNVNLWRRIDGNQ